MRTSPFKLAVYDKPPHYEHEILTNIEEINISSSQSSRELNKSFQNISNTLNDASAKVISSIENEAEKARIQSAIENEIIANGISETNYRLLDVANGIDDLGGIISYGNNNIIDVIGKSSQIITNGLSNIDKSLDNMDFKLEMVNHSLHNISNQLASLLAKISKPNETEALELADQARINLSLKKKEIALKVTKNALELSNGTSITVLAYHILTLSLFDDEVSQKEIVDIYEDYTNLINFKLSDYKANIEIIAQEINNTVYPVMKTMGNISHSSIMLITQNLYKSLYQNRDNLDDILSKPIFYNSTLAMIQEPNQLREFHWSVLLKEYVLQKHDLNIYANYIALLSNSDVLIKNELMVLAVRNFYEEGFLYGAIIDSLIKHHSQMIDDAIRVSIIFLPQKNININLETYFAMKIYAEHNNAQINTRLEEIFEKAQLHVREHIEENYIPIYDKNKQLIFDKENEINKQIKSIRKEHFQVSNKKMKEWKQHNKLIDDNNYPKKIKNASNEISDLNHKIGSEAISQFFKYATIVIMTAYIIYNFSNANAKEGIASIFVMIPLVIVMYFIGVFLDNLISSFREGSKEGLIKNHIPFYEKELAKKYNIEKLKDELDAPYNQKVSTLNDQLSSYNKIKNDELILQLKSIVDSYLPYKLEQLANSQDELFECIRLKIIGYFIVDKQPNESRQKNDTSVNKIEQNKQEYCEIDIELLAKTYNEELRAICPQEQLTSERIISLLEDKAYNNDSMAQYLLGHIYSSDDDDFDIKQDKAKSFFWFEKAATLGLSDAQAMIGGDYLKGEYVEKNIGVALQWFEKGKELGNSTCKYNYGLIKFVYGTLEIKEEGIYWIKEARDDGLVEAQKFIFQEKLE